MKKILIALDFDPSAEKIAQVGFLLAKSLGAKVVLAHVIVDLVYYSLSYMKMGLLQLDSTVELKTVSKQFLDKTKHQLGDDTIQTLILEGDFADSILKTATDLHADLIVMGSHSRRWMENTALGSVTEKVLTLTSIPLFIVPLKKHNELK